MRMKVKPLPLALLAAIALGASSISQSQNFDPPTTFGEVIGGQITDVYISVQNARQVTRARTEEIESARKEYFECYPDCPELEAKKHAFANQLGQKDWDYLSLSLAGQNYAVGMLAGAIDGGIHSGCAADFNTWTTAVYEAMGGGIIAFKMDQLMPALEAGNKHYEKYVVCRDKGEFEKYFGLAESLENPRLRRGALVAVDRNFQFQDYDWSEYSNSDRRKIEHTIRRMADGKVHVLMCEYGPFENTTGSVYFKPYKIMEAWYKSPPPNLEELERVRGNPASHLGKDAMVCCPETSNDFFAVRTGKVTSAGCKAPPALIKSSLFFWRQKDNPSDHLSTVRLDPDGRYVCVYTNGEIHKFNKEVIDRVYRGKCPPEWAPEFAVEREILDSGDVRYTYTNGESILMKGGGSWRENWIPDKTSWWRFGDPDAQEDRSQDIDRGGINANAPKDLSVSHASETSDKTQAPDRAVASGDAQPTPDASGATGESLLKEPVTDKFDEPVQSIEVATRQLGTPAYDCMDADTAELLKMNYGLVDESKFFSPAHSRHDAETRRRAFVNGNPDRSSHLHISSSYPGDGELDVADARPSWGFFFDESFTRQQIDGRVSEALNRWDQRRREVFDGDVSLCIGLRETDSVLPSNPSGQLVNTTLGEPAGQRLTFFMGDSWVFNFRDAIEPELWTMLTDNADRRGTPRRFDPSIRIEILLDIDDVREHDVGQGWRIYEVDASISEQRVRRLR